MKKIQKKDVEHMALLSRLNISEDEKEKYAEQFSEILEYFDSLQEVETKDIEPIDQISDLKNVSREDELDEKFDRDKMLSNAPEQENGFIKVKSVFNKKQ